MCANGGGACQVNTSTATCSAGTVVGGGWNSDSPDVVVPYAQRVTPTTYSVIAINYASVSRSITAQAICASGPGVSGTSPAVALSDLERALTQAKEEVLNRAAR
jgi:hypothetical protein